MGTKIGHKGFVIHVKNDYDYRFATNLGGAKERAEIIDTLRQCVYLKTKQILPVYGVPSKLKSYAQTKNDLFQGKPKNIPEEKYRL